MDGGDLTVQDKKIENPPAVSTTIFVLKVNDRPGAMELIAATFAHRGVSLTSLLGNGASLDPNGEATVLVAFTAPSAKKAAIKGALGRLSRVISLVEYSGNESSLRTAALIRVAADMPILTSDNSCHLETVETNGANGETTYAVLGTPIAVDRLLGDLRTLGNLRAVTQTVLAL